MSSATLRFRNQELDQLIQAAKAVNSLETREMNEIVGRFEPMVQRTARDMTTDVELRQDLTNAGRMAVVTAVSKYTGPGAFPVYARVYVLGAMKRELSGWLPPREVRLAEPLDDEVDAGRIGRIVTDSPVTADRTWGELTPVIEKLQDGQREILTLHFVDDLTVEMTAAKVGASPSALSHRMMTIYRGVAKALAA